MSNIKSFLFVICAALMFFAGCGGQQQFKEVKQICAEGLEETKVVQAAENVLGEMHFAVDKADAKEGFIRTRPLSGAQFFEFWRKDNVGAFNSAEANLQSIRRIVEMSISRQGGQLCVNCDVKVQRLNLPEYQQITGSERTYEMFSRSDAVIQKPKISSEQKKQMDWVDLGDDPKLAAEILNRLEKRIGKGL
jgi:hypothetical protein